MRAICFDLGDTIMDETTEVKDETGTTLRADLIPGVAELLHELHRRGCPLALVSDSRPYTPINVLRQHGLLELFEVLAISEVVGVSKPHPRIFLVALNGLGIPPEAYGHVAMVGNNLERDVAGARRLGMVSVFFQWNTRYRTRPLDPEEVPDFTVHSAQELASLLLSSWDRKQQDWG